MSSSSLNSVIGQVMRTVRQGSPSVTDGRLLERFVTHRDEEAFETLVWRHGPMVWSTCRRILGHAQDVEDAFQATFLVLSRKAKTITNADSLGCWLHQVAHRTCLRAKSRATRLRTVELPAVESANADASSLVHWREMKPVLDDELGRLPEKYRSPLILHYLEGKTVAQTAAELRWPIGTVGSRLAKSRELLRKRLTRRGVTLSTAALSGILAEHASAGIVTGVLVSDTVKVVTASAVGLAATVSTASVKVIALADGVLRGMMLAKLKFAAALVMAVGLISTGTGLVAVRGMPRGGEAVAQGKESSPSPPKPGDSVVAAPAMVWPEGATVKGQLVNHLGEPVANAEVLLLGDERIIVEADRKTWFTIGDRTNRATVAQKPPSTRTNENGEFRIKRNKGSADRLAIISADPIFWTVARKNLPRDSDIKVQLPQVGSLTIHCDLPGKPQNQRVMIEARVTDGKPSEVDFLRFHFADSSISNPGETTFEHLPPGQCTVERSIDTPTGKRGILQTGADRQLVKIESDKRAAVRFERKKGRPLTGQVRGLENVELRYAFVDIGYFHPADGRLTAFDVIPIKSDGRFTTDLIPPGQYMISLFAIRSSTPEQSSQQADFSSTIMFTVPGQGDIPTVELVAKSNNNKRPTQDACIGVIDDAGKPLPKFEAMIHTPNHGYSHWMDGRDGLAYLGLPSPFPESEVLELYIRANGYAASLMRIEGKQRDQLRTGKATVTMHKGQKVELRFRLPGKLTWPNGVMPETYFDEMEERVQIMHQPENRKGGPSSDFNMLNVREIGPAQFELHLAPSTPRFHVAIHAPGFLQYFESGPFTLADVKQGALEIEVPHPATLEARFDLGDKMSSDAPLGSITLSVMRQLHGNSYLSVARDEVPSAGKHELRITDLASGVYMVNVDASPKQKAQRGNAESTEPVSGSYAARANVTLRAGKTERVDFRYTPFDRNAFRGNHTAVLRIRLPDGQPAADRTVSVVCNSNHGPKTGSNGDRNPRRLLGFTVYTGLVPKAGELTLKHLADKVDETALQYSVNIDGDYIGQFSFEDKKRIQDAGGKPELFQEFDFRVRPGPGDLAPDVELLNLATGKSIRLSSLRGKIVCLEFWSTTCGPCQRAMSKLNQLVEEQAVAWGDRVSIVPVSIDEATDRVQYHMKRRGWNLLASFWTGDSTRLGFDAPAARSLGVSAIPEAILLSRDGRIIWRGHPMSNSSGQEPKSLIEAALRAQP